MKIQSLILTLTITAMTYAQNSSFQPTVEVTGNGVVTVVPDEVTITVRVENTGKNAIDVKRQNDATVSEVLQAAKQMGVQDKHINTQYVRLNKNYDYATKTYNFVSNQAIVLKVIDLKKYEPLMNALLESGINRIDGVQFSSSEKDVLVSDARKKAITHAKMKATEYAGVLGQKVGKALHISEYTKSNTQAQPMLRMASIEQMGGGSSQQTLAPGEMEITVEVYVTFELI